MVSRLQLEVVGQQNQPLVGGGVVETHAPEGVRINPRRCGRVEDERVTGEHALVDGGGARVAPVQQDVLLGTHDIESRAEHEHVEPGEVEVAAVHHVERARLGYDLIERVDIVTATRGDAHERGNGAAQVEQGMQLDCGKCPKSS